MRRLVTLSALLVAGAATAPPAAARDCRPVEGPPGVRLPERPGCKPPAPARDGKIKTGRTPGFIDLGGGAEVRFGGSVDVEVQRRR
jgi:hypothetical protein